MTNYDQSSPNISHVISHKANIEYGTHLKGERKASDIAWQYDSFSMGGI